jgi:protein-arginine deiminase
MKAAVAVVVALFTFSALESNTPVSVQIAADVNRDGIVEFSADEAGEDRWSRARGAIFLNNCDSDQGTGTPDHEDDIINGPEDLKDLAVVRIARIPDLPQDARVSIEVDPASRSRVRLFSNTQGESYIPMALTGDADIPGERLRAEEMELRIEANSFADAGWTGETTLTLTVWVDGEVSGSDSVVLKVAPFILLSNLQRGITAYAREVPGRNDSFLVKLKDLLPRTGCAFQIIPSGPPYRAGEVWLQDCVEIGYAEMPGSRMSVALKANRNRSLDRLARDFLMDRDYGFLQCGSYRESYGRGRGGNGWLDWYGNLEVTPPLADYPMGRVYYGFNPDDSAEASLNPAIVKMLDAQGVQGPPLRLDTGWLMIKHVDELISFVPGGKGSKGVRIMVVDPESMLSLLKQWRDGGLGEERLLRSFREEETVASLLDDPDLVQHNRYLQKERIEPTVDTLMRELRLEEGDFVRIPALFDERGRAVFPNMVNSLILNGHIYIADPNGPLVDGRDLLKEEMRQRLKDLPLTPHFFDDRHYHRGSGNVHCATNVRREGFPAPWWK